MGVTLRHNARLAATGALLAAVVAVAWFSRALQTGSVGDWLWCAALSAVGVLLLLVVRDSRAPLLLADEQGVRVRHGEAWSGLRWSDIEQVEVRSPSRWLGDGRVVVRPRLEADETYSAPLGHLTRVVADGLTGELVPDLEALSGGTVPVLVLARPRSDRRADPEGAADAQARVEDESSDAEPQEATGQEAEQAVEPEIEPVAPERKTRPAARAEVVRDSVRMLPSPPAIPHQRGADSPVIVARIADEAPVDEVPIDGVPILLGSAEESTPPKEPVIGPLVAAARHRARLSIDTLSDRTRIRPHVLERIEVDDFGACGGDFYARGHLRTLARMLGLDTDALLALYDQRYASPAIEARQVFEAELATGIAGGMRGSQTGPRWSVLVAAVVVLAGIWGVARVFNDTPQELVSPAPSVVDSAGLAHAQPAGRPSAPRSTLAPIEVRAVGASPQVVVRDKDGRILWAGRLAQGQRQQVIGLAPFEVTTTIGQAVEVRYLGKPRGTVGGSQVAGSKQYG